MKKKTKNKQDATLINVQAAKKRDGKLELKIRELELQVTRLKERVDTLVMAVSFLNIPNVRSFLK